MCIFLGGALEILIDFQIGFCSKLVLLGAAREIFYFGASWNPAEWKCCFRKGGHLFGMDLQESKNKP